MATFSTIATVAAAVVGAAGAVSAGRSAQQQANFQATVQRQQADRERQQAAADEEDFRRRQRALMATRRAVQGGSGTEIGTGTSLLRAKDFAAESELMALRIRSGGEASATRLEQEAEATQFGGRVARRQGFVRGGSLLLSGAGRAFA